MGTTKSENMQGICQDFCPHSEFKMRVKENLLHYYEFNKRDGKNVPGILIKCFLRSAAGIKMPSNQDLRTQNCLQRTIEYLLKDILLDKRKPFVFAYEFIFDRLRAVRQEIKIQTMNAKQAMVLLEPIIMFLSYSRYRLCEQSIQNFDPKICEQHLHECLEDTLYAYDQIPTSELNLEQLKNRVFIEALYQIFNLDRQHALRRAIILPNDVKKTVLFQQCFQISLNKYQGNIYRVIRQITQLPHILCAIGALQMQLLRSEILETFAHAYNSKQLSVPVDYLVDVMQYEKEKSCLDYCISCNLRLTDDKKSVQFQKIDFKINANCVKPSHEYFVEQKLKYIYLPEVLLMKKL